MPLPSGAYAPPSRCSYPPLPPDAGYQRARSDKVWTGLYAAWNCAQFARNRRDILAMHPEYNQCWFSQQAEWNLYSYNCAETINHLPYEYKLLWHNQTIDHPFLSNCNLPSICGKCRGPHGTKRPEADLMGSEPCGFCRCGSDMLESKSRWATSLRA